MDLLSNAIDPGVLRQKVELRDMGGPKDAGHEPTERVVATVWARVQAMSGQARYMTSQYADRASHVITIRYREGVSSDMTVYFGATKFEVVYPLDPEYRHRWLHLLCMEVVPT